MSSPGPRHSRCELFLKNIGPGPCPYPGDSQCEYTIRWQWAKKARLFIVDEMLCSQLMILENNVSLHVPETGSRYDIQMEGNDATLRRNQLHIKPRSFDIPSIHSSYLQQNSAPLEGNAPTSRG